MVNPKFLGMGEQHNLSYNLFPYLRKISYYLLLSIRFTLRTTFVNVTITYSKSREKKVLWCNHWMKIMILKTLSTILTSIVYRCNSSAVIYPTHRGNCESKISVVTTVTGYGQDINQWGKTASSYGGEDVKVCCMWCAWSEGEVHTREDRASVLLWGHGRDTYGTVTP